MDVIGYDPYISVETAWRLSTHVQRAFSLDEILQRVIILHCIFLLRIKRRDHWGTRCREDEKRDASI